MDPDANRVLGSACWPSENSRLRLPPGLNTTSMESCRHRAFQARHMPPSDVHTQARANYDNLDHGPEPDDQELPLTARNLMSLLNFSTDQPSAPADQPSPPEDHPTPPTEPVSRRFPVPSTPARMSIQSEPPPADHTTLPYNEISEAWNVAMMFSKKRLQSVKHFTEEDVEHVSCDGPVVLETVCIFIHASLRTKQFHLPAGFWKCLQEVYGITVFPSAFMEEQIDTYDVGKTRMFMDSYGEHIFLTTRFAGPFPTRCPIDLIQHAPPPYQQ